MNKLNKNCFTNIRDPKEDIASLPENPYVEFEDIIAKSQAARLRARARDVASVVPDILSGNVAPRWMMPHTMKPSSGRARGKAKDSGMARDHPEKEKVVHITLMVAMVSA